MECHDSQDVAGQIQAHEGRWYDQQHLGDLNLRRIGCVFANWKFLIAFKAEKCVFLTLLELTDVSQGSIGIIRSAGVELILARQFARRF